MRSGDLTNRSHIMPQPPKIPWTSSALPWTMPSTSTNCTSLMEFNAQQIPISSNCPKHFQHKRKSEFIDSLSTPNKQFITEDKMAAHLNKMHISSDYVTHTTNTSNMEESTDITSSMNNNSSDITDEDLEQIYPITTKELEEKLKRANRISVCKDVIKNLKQENIIPQALLNHYQSPCKALILWQPPPKLTDFIREENRDDYDSDSDSNAMDNNNSSSVDLNNFSMETDIF